MGRNWSPALPWFFLDCTLRSAIVGAVGVTLLEAADGEEDPIALVATTVQLTGVPLGRPMTVIGELAPLAIWPPQVAV